MCTQSSEHCVPRITQGDLLVGPPHDPAYPSLHRQRKPDIDHLSTGCRPPPHTLLTPPSTQTPSTTRDQASVREGRLAIDMKCGTKCRNGAPQTHIESSAQTSQPSSQAFSVVNFWHAMQDQRQLFLRETPFWMEKKSSWCQSNQEDYFAYVSIFRK